MNTIRSILCALGFHSERMIWTTEPRNAVEGFRLVIEHYLCRRERCSRLRARAIVKDGLKVVAA